MRPTRSIRWASWLAVSGGVFWIAFHLYYISSGISHLELGASILIAALGIFFMALAVVSLLRKPNLGSTGKSGAGILLAGMILFILGASLSGLDLWDGAWLLAIGGEALTTLGLAAFSLGALAEAPRAFWKWLPLTLAPVYFVSFSTTSASFPAWAPTYTPEWLAVIYGLGWVVLGAVQALKRSEPQFDELPSSAAVDHLRVAEWAAEGRNSSR